MTSATEPTECDTVKNKIDIETLQDDNKITPVIAGETNLHFNYWSCLGLSFSISSVPLSIGAYLSLAVGAGGPPFFFYSFLFAGLLQLVACLALAEVASAIPHSTGPAYWIAYLAPDRFKQFLQYLFGWITNAAWLLITATSLLYLAGILLAIIEAAHPNYIPEAKAWHQFLIYVGFAFLTFLLNLPPSIKILNYSLASAIGIVNGTALFTLIALLVRAQPKQSATAVFRTVINETGWDSDAVVFFISIVPGIAAIGAFDSASHLTNEVPEPGKNIPKVMLGSAITNFVSCFIAIIIYLFCIVNPEGLLAPVNAQPLVQLIFDGLRSDTLSIICGSLIIVSFTIGSAATFTSWNRLYWSFSCSGGFPASRWTSELSGRNQVPVNALVVNLVAVIAIGAIQLGSTTALTSLLSGAILCSSITVLMVLSMLLWRGRSSLPRRWLDLGRFGYCVDLISVTWALFVSIWVCFPTYVPVIPSTMNWSSVVFAGLVVLAVVFYFTTYKKRAEIF